MSKPGSKEEILSAIQAHFEKIQSGTLTAEDMESLVELTRELHERALILRYKSYEEKIFGVRTPAPETQEETEPEKETEAPAAPEAPEEAPAAQEVEPVQHAIGFEEVEAEILRAESAPVAEEPVFDFDMFEKAEADIFTITSPPQSSTQAPLFEEKTETSAPAEEAKPETEAKPEAAMPVSEAQQIADEVEESPVTISQEMPISSPPPSYFEETRKPEPEAVKPEPTPEIPLPEELALMNEPVIVPEKAPQPESDMFSKMNTAPAGDSLSARLASTKLHTLAGAFGLNEKLQCIRELFKGSSEAFNAAIETLDQQENFAAAKRILAQYAQQNSWNLESNLTAEFIQKVERRFL